MLFNSYLFIFLLMPITLLGFHVLVKYGKYRCVIAWLVIVSLFFYGWWNPVYLGLMIGSILFNYTVGRALLRYINKYLLTFGVIANLGMLVYFKYANFIVDNLNILMTHDIVLEQIMLPLAISFFTFQQITYLIDAYRGETQEHSFLHYCLFVTFFPQLIAGPIVHHKEMLPQFAKAVLRPLRSKNLAIGMTIFIIGLFKKVVIADGLAVYATPIFSAAEQGIILTFFEAWLGAFAYSFQLYFDFSGYSEMAIGLARMFGVILPVNFFSPYKALNIINFWRRWHITLSRFLKDYLYIPLGGNRKGPFRRYVHLMLTMLIGGFWHGAAWTFVLWGGLHGLFLVVNHAWHFLKYKLFGLNSEFGFFGRVVAQFITFVLVVIAWVMFRAETFNGAMLMYESMFAVHGISLPASAQLYWGETLAVFDIYYDGMFHHGVVGNPTLGWSLVVAAMLISFLLPNVMEWMSDFNPALGLKRFSGESLFKWKVSRTYLFLVSLMATYTLMNISGASEFLYFRF